MSNITLFGRTIYGLERKVEFDPAYDKRHADDNKNYGIHGVNMRFVVNGSKGAIVLLIFTNWHLPMVREELDMRYGHTLPAEQSYIRVQSVVQPADLGYHSKKPQYEGQEALTKDCQYLNGKPCYYDGSGLQAETYFDYFVEKGEDVLWRLLEDRYHVEFNNPIPLHKRILKPIVNTFVSYMNVFKADNPFTGKPFEEIK